MSIPNLIKEGASLFKNKKFDEAITKLNQALDRIKIKIVIFRSRIIFIFCLVVAILSRQ